MTSVDIAGPAGRLEADLMLPEAPPRAAAVLCHAHPLHGGIMHFKVLYRVAKTLQALGAAVLRFNFRGVGRSEGTYDHGRGEQADARAALAEIAQRFPGVPLLMGGFSFGSVMALRAGEADARAQALLVMGLPLEHMREREFVSRLHAPRLFVQGENDEYGSGAALAVFVEPLPEPRSLVVIPGADHYFTGRLDELQAAVAGWARALWR